MKKAIHSLICLAAATLVAVPAWADKGLTWFGEIHFSGAYPEGASTPEHIMPASTARVFEALDKRFGATHAVAAQASLERFLSGRAQGSDYDHMLRSEFGFTIGRERISMPLYYAASETASGVGREFGGFGLKWQHDFGHIGSLSVSAGYGHAAGDGVAGLFGGDQAIAGTGTMASVSWATSLDNKGTGVVGSIYVANEQSLQRFITGLATLDMGTGSVYGFAVGGQWAVTPEHLPYIAFHYRMSDPVPNMYGFADPAVQLSAGWNWQVSSQWRVRAEADFGYAQPTINLFDTTRTRILFSTRFDLR